MLKKILLLITLAVLGVSLIGCNTVQGVGKDIQRVGEAGEEILN